MSSLLGLLATKQTNENVHYQDGKLQRAQNCNNVRSGRLCMKLFHGAGLVYKFNLSVFPVSFLIKRRTA